jgi:hypothetical protein
MGIKLFPRLIHRARSARRPVKADQPITSVVDDVTAATVFPIE